MGVPQFIPVLIHLKCIDGFSMKSTSDILGYPGYPYDFGTFTEVHRSAAVRASG